MRRTLLLYLFLFVVGLAVVPVLHAPISAGLTVDADSFILRSASVFNDFRMEPVWRMLRLALYSVAITLAGTILLTIPLLLLHQRKLILLLQFVFFIPFFISPIIRTHSLRGFLFSISLFQDGGRLSELVNTCLFSEIGVVIGLTYSFSGFVLIPFAQSLLSTKYSQIWALKDSGVSVLKQFSLLLRLHRSSLLFGAALMLSLAWFSANEPSVLGQSESVLSSLEGMVSVRKNLEAAVFSLATFAGCIVSLVLLLRFLKPEQLLSAEIADQ